MKLETSCTVLFTAVSFRAVPPRATSRTFGLPWLLLCGTGGEGQGQGRELRDGRPRRGPSPPTRPRRGRWVERGCVFPWRQQRSRCQAQRRARAWSARPRHRQVLAQHFCILVSFDSLRNRRKCLFPSFINERMRVQSNQSRVSRIPGPVGKRCRDLLSDGSVL